MQRTHEIFNDIGNAEQVDIETAKKTLYASLIASRGKAVTAAYYLNTLISALKCRIIDERTYTEFSMMGVFEKIPFNVMANGLNDQLIDTLEMDFASRDAAKMGRLAHCGQITGTEGDSIPDAGQSCGEKAVIEDVRGEVEKATVE